MPHTQNSGQALRGYYDELIIKNYWRQVPTRPILYISRHCLPCSRYHSWATVMVITSLVPAQIEARRMPRQMPSGPGQIGQV